MTLSRHIHNILLLIVLSIYTAPGARAQRFAVASYRTLSNDVSAFIDPVQDLNGDDCGLIKVQAGPEYVFTSPLGIVKRIDKTGEIWLYVPRGTKKITIRHPQLGILRDYELPERVDSHLTYELRLSEPEPPATPERVVTTVHDTLLLTRVDTLLVRPVRAPVPLQFEALVTGSYGGKAGIAAPGIMLMALKRHGGFVHAVSNFGSIGKTVGTCDADGLLNGSLPYYSGAKRTALFMINAGAVQRLSRRVAIFEGIGYGSTAVAWQLDKAEVGGYVRNSRYCVSGVSFEAGARLSFKRLSVSASVMSIRAKEWYGTVGIGVRLGK